MLRPDHRSPLRNHALLLAVLLPPLATALRPSPSPGLGQDGVGSNSPGGLLAFQAEQQRRLTEALVGSWRLTEFNHAVNDLSGVPVAGQMTLTQDGFLNMIIHTLDPDPLIFFNGELLVQAGVHSWRIDQRGILQTATLMAHSNFNDGLVTEPSFYPREYRVEFFGDDEFLTLTRPDNSRLQFRRLQRSVFPGVALDQIRAAQPTAEEGEGEEEESDS